jgi:hypothetical protein
MGADLRVIVVSLRRAAPAVPGGYTPVRVDRKSPLGLGNPYPLARESDRPAVLARYGALLARDLARGGRRARAIAALSARVRAGERLALACWCAPKPCHADALRAAVLAQTGLARA